MDMLKLKSLTLTIFVCGFLSLSHAAQYESTAIHYTIRYDATWEKVSTPEYTIDLMIACHSNACSKDSNLTIGATYTPQLAKGTMADFLKNMRGQGAVITTNVSSQPFVTDFKIIREGQTKIGQIPAYEVVMKYKYVDGRQRTRHTFMTFNKGYIYNLSFHSTPNNYEKDFKLILPVLNSFQFK